MNSTDQSRSSKKKSSKRKSKNRSKKSSQKKNLKKLFVGGLPPQLKNNELIEYFEEFGELLEAQIMFDKESKKSRGFAFVTFKSAESVTKVLAQDHILYDKVIDCKMAFSKSKARHKILNERERKIFVGGLTPETNQLQLKAYFEQFGDVDIANVILDPNTQKSRCFGFIIFRNKKSVYKVLNHRDKHFLNKKWIDCKPALLREEIKKDIDRDEIEETQSQKVRTPIMLPPPQKPARVGLSLPGPISHHPHELYNQSDYNASEWYSSHQSYSNNNEMRPPMNRYPHDPRSMGPPSHMGGFRGREMLPQPPRMGRAPPNPNWRPKFSDVITPTTASHQSPGRLFARDQPGPGYHSNRAKYHYQKQGNNNLHTPRSGFGAMYHGHPMHSPFVRSAQNKYSCGPKHAKNFSNYFDTEIVEAESEGDTEKDEEEKNLVMNINQ